MPHRQGSPQVRGNERSGLLTLSRSYSSRLLAGDDHVSQYLSLAADAMSEGGQSHLVHNSGNPAAREAVWSRSKPVPCSGVPMQDLQAFELRTYLEGDVLVKEDRATMSVGLEGRVPFLDAQVAGIAAQIPVAQRASMVYGKKVLRAVAERRLGHSRMPTLKRGFAVPLDALFRGEWHDESIAWFRAASSDLVETGAVADSIAAGKSAASDVWALAAPVAWESRIRSARERARPESMV